MQPLIRLVVFIRDPLNKFMHALVPWRTSAWVHQHLGLMISTIEKKQKRKSDETEKKNEKDADETEKKNKKEADGTEKKKDADETEKKKKKDADETEKKNKKEADGTEKKKDADETEKKKKKDADETEKKNKKEADETDEKNKKEADETNEQNKKDADETGEQNKKDADETDEQNKKATGDIKWNPELGKACWQKKRGLSFPPQDDEVTVSFGGLLWSVPHLVPSDLDPSMPANPPQQKVKAKAAPKAKQQAKPVDDYVYPIIRCKYCAQGSKNPLIKIEAREDRHNLQSKWVQKLQVVIKDNLAVQKAMNVAKSFADSYVYMNLNPGQLNFRGCRDSLLAHKHDWETSALDWQTINKLGLKHFPKSQLELCYFVRPCWFGYPHDPYTSFLYMHAPSHARDNTHTHTPAHMHAYIHT